MDNKIPFSIKYPLYFLVALMFLVFLQLASDILIPLTIAGIFTMILYPVTKKMESLGVHRVPSIIISMSALTLIIFVVFSIFTSQLIHFAANFPELSDQLIVRFEKIKEFVGDRFPGNQNDLLDTVKDSFASILNTGGSIISDTISITTVLVTNLVLIPIYIFLFLLYRDHVKKFIFMITPTNQHEEAHVITTKVQSVLRDYVSGLMSVIFIIALLNSAGLAIIGIDYAVFFGCLAALLTIIPYFGIIMGSIFPLIVAFLTKDSLWYPVGVMAVFGTVQFLEGNFLTPKIIGSKVSVNPITAILAILIGGKIWGTAGLILFVPLIAVLKVFLDAFESTKPYGMLLGDEGIDPSIEKHESPYERFVKMFKKKSKS